MLAKILLSSCLLLLGIPLWAQQSEITFSDFFPLPGKQKAEASDLSARGGIRLQGDSIIVEIQVTDNQVVQGEDRIDVWLSLPEIQFSDYLVGKSGNKSRLFRNSAEAGDEASIERLVKNGDYPKQKRIDVDGVMRDVSVPPASTLIEDYVHFGMAQYSFFTGSSAGKHNNLANYKALESQLGGMPDDLSAATSLRYKTEDGGYTMRMALHNSCLAFTAFNLKSFKVVVDVFDVDAPGDKPHRFSSTANRFTHRPFYFHTLQASPEWQFVPDGIPPAVLKQTGIQLYLYRKQGQWQPFGFGNGAIIYAEGMVSEAGLVEFTFYPMQCTYRRLEKPFDAVEEIRVKYRDLSAFSQVDVYFLHNNKAIISKGYRYLAEEKEDFVNRPFFLPNGQMAFVLYDYEPADHLGWGEYGRLADEFIYIQIPGKEGVPMFSAGQRLEVVHSASFGEHDQVACEQVKSVNYRWIEPGKTFEVRVKGLSKNTDRQLRFGLNTEGQFRLIP